MSIQMVGWVLDQHIPDSGMKLVLISLANCHNGKHGQCNPGIEVLMREASLSRSTVIRKLKALEDDGWIKVSAEHDSAGRQKANSYIINQQDRGEGVTMTPPANPAIIAQGEGVTMTPRPVSSDTPEGVNCDTPLKEPEKEPESFPLPPEPQKEGGKGFSRIWDEWHPDFIPDSREYAEKQFGKLTDAERDAAVAHVREYLALCAKRGKHPLMVPYLKTKAFAELAGAPETDSDGDFVITPARPEWREWLGAMRKSRGPAAVEYFVKLGRIVVKTRWPEGYVHG